LKTQIESSFTRVSIARKSRVGVLDSISRFQSLAKSADAIFADSERRVDLDKWLEKLADAVLAGIDATAASPNSKYPAAIVRMENLHSFYCKLFIS
jgi:exocyst complex component 1